VIRPARSGDLDALAHVERRAGERFRAVGMPAIADADPYDADELNGAAALLVAADEDDIPIGYAMVETVEGHPHLAQLSVVPERGGEGVGSALLEAVAEWALGHGHREITLTTFRDVPFNRPYYERRGYEVVPATSWSPALADLVAREAGLGLDPALRVVMRRRL
jgi:GNAT superfamily N-acetyltransferase